MQGRLPMRPSGGISAGDGLHSTIMTDPFVQRLARIDCCAVSDALDKLGLTGCTFGGARRGVLDLGRGFVGDRRNLAMELIHGRALL